MLAKRIIPCLDVDDGRVVKGRKFKEIRDVADPVDLGKRYSEEGADELVFYDITASHQKRGIFLDVVERVAENVRIPFTIGGGISSPEDFRKVLLAGADKVSVNSSAVKDPELISEAARRFGSQCVVLSIDASETDRAPGTCLSTADATTPGSTRWNGLSGDRISAPEKSASIPSILTGSRTASTSI